MPPTVLGSNKVPVFLLTLHRSFVSRKSGSVMSGTGVAMVVSVVGGTRVAVTVTVAVPEC